MFDISGQEEEIRSIEAESADPDLWRDQARARAIMRQLGAKRDLVQTWRGLEREVADLYDMAALAIEEGDHSLEEELEQELQRLTAELERLETRLVLSGDYDDRNAMLAFHAGAGGTESQDWANMLL
ncbi:MAG TPA: PCRF domain-containing protein, partial [Dehalococcoidia bacterium]|nr:PCRF domain-containing protein [Dehalococcoidia bacterium]